MKTLRKPILKKESKNTYEKVLQEYFKLNNNCFSTTSELRKIIKKLKALNIYSQIAPMNKYYIKSENTINSENKYSLKYNLTDRDIKKHLFLEQTLYCFPYTAITSNWLMISSTSYRNLEQNKIHTLTLIEILKEYIPQEYICCYTNGLNNFNIVIYFEKYQYRNKIIKFQNNIIFLAKLKAADKEFKCLTRPNLINDELNKQSLILPFGKNYLNRNNDTNTSLFVDINNLNIIENQVAHFLNIKKLPHTIFYNKSKLVTQHYNKQFQKYMKNPIFRKDVSPNH